MKPPAGWLELSLVAGGLMAVMLVVMWAGRPDASCTLPLEAPRTLVLSRETDREHLTTDLASADRIARRHIIHRGAVVDPVEQHARFIDCETALVQQIATRHGLAPERVRTVPADAP